MPSCASVLLSMVGWSEATSPAKLAKAEEKILSSKCDMLNDTTLLKLKHDQT